MKDRVVGKHPALGVGYGASPLDSLVNHYVDGLRYFVMACEEKTMSKIDWHKPIRAFDGTAAKPYNSHGTRVVWIGDYVYPVDENGRATASVYYPKATGRSCSVGERLVENVPEEVRDHIAIRYTERGEYNVDAWGGEQLQTKAFLESYFRCHDQKPDGLFKGYFIVKVPV